METTQNPTEHRTLNRRSPQERARLIAEFKVSRLSRAEFCKKHDIHPTTFSGWLKRKGKSEQPAFRRVDVSGRFSSALEIILPNGVRLSLGQSLSVSDLVELVHGVSSC